MHSGREVRRLAALPGILLALLCSAGALRAQTPPDSIVRDSLTKAALVRDSLVRDSLARDSLARETAARDSLARQSAARDSLSRIAAVQDSARLARERYVRDSIRAFRAADTVKAPLARFERPPEYDVTPRLHFDRKEILSSGATYLTDLLERVPGVTGFRSGWLTGMHTAAYNGDFQRVRIFLDGVELDGSGPREHGVLDEVMLPLWTLETIDIEQTATEVRVWCRTMTPERTTPYSRVDILTGDLNTNAFRGMFMRRFGNGVALQLGGHQLSTQQGRGGTLSGSGAGGTSSGGFTGDGDQQVYSARLGWARRKWSIDGYGVTTSLHRDRTDAPEGYTSLPAFDGGRREAYLRAAYGDTSSGPWLLAMRAFSRSRLGVTSSGEAKPDSTLPDTTRTIAQTVLGAGFRRGTLALSLIDRIRNGEGLRSHSPALRITMDRGWLAAGAFLERTAFDSTRKSELSVRLRPTPWSAVVLSHSARRVSDSSIYANQNGLLAEAALRFRGRWLGAGVIRTDEAVALSPEMLGAARTGLIVPASTGALFSVVGPVYRALAIDMQGTVFDKAAFGRPRMRILTELRLATDWLSRFPLGDFSVDARLRHEMRDPVSFYYGAGPSGEAIVRSTESKQLLTAMLEIRIQQATLFYQSRNLTGAAYAQIPGIVMPPTVQMYGVRWEFWN